MHENEDEEAEDLLKGLKSQKRKWLGLSHNSIDLGYCESTTRDLSKSEAQVKIKAGLARAPHHASDDPCMSAPQMGMHLDFIASDIVRCRCGSAGDDFFKSPAVERQNQGSVNVDLPRSERSHKRPGTNWSFPLLQASLDASLPLGLAFEKYYSLPRS